jgi:O-antigen/teichoic acid export membrane protein
MTRHAQLKKLAFLNLSGEAGGFLISVAWAIISPSVWALVAGKIGATLIYTIGSHLVAKNWVSLRWDRDAARDICTFGSGMLLASVTYFLGGEAERLIVGKFISIAELGCFSLALTLSAAPAMLVSNVAGQVLFPRISQIVRDHPDSVARYFHRARFLFLAISIVVGFGFITCSKLFVDFLLPPQYAAMSWMLQWLGFRAAQQIFTVPTSCLILAYGNSKQGAVANVIRLIFMLVGMWLGFTIYGTHMAIASLAIAYVAAYIALMPALVRHSRPSLWVELQGFVLFCLSMAIAAIIPWPWL